MPNEHINLPGISAADLAAGNPPALPIPVQPISTQPGLTPEQLGELQAVGESYRVIRRTAAVARFSGVTSIVLGVGGLACLGFGVQLSGILAVVVLLTVGFIELTGRQWLLNGKSNALRVLAFNQLGFLAAIAIYCGVQIATFSSKSLTQSLNTKIQEMGGGDLGDLIDPKTAPQMAQSVNTGFYGLVLLVSIASQGGLAWYYARRGKYLEAYRSAEPWQRDLLQKVSN